MKTALVAISKNEGPYLREWVLYHKKICGFDDIIIYENDSADNSKEELDRLKSDGLCDWIDWPRSKRNPPQQLAYRDALLKKDNYDWICCMDIDEFLVLRADESIGEFVSTFDEDTGSISFNWAIFYSLDAVKSNEPVIKRVNYCHGDTHVKTIARSKAIVKAGIHTFWLTKGFKYMHCSGAEYKLDNKVVAHIDAKMCKIPGYCMFDCSRAHINHYSMKSEEEVIIKDNRGSATRKEHFQKDSISSFRRLSKMSDHYENNSIKKFIDKRYGLEKFYEEVMREK